MFGTSSVVKLLYPLCHPLLLKGPFVIFDSIYETKNFYWCVGGLNAISFGGKINFDAILPIHCRSEFTV